MVSPRSDSDLIRMAISKGKDILYNPNDMDH